MSLMIHKCTICDKVYKSYQSIWNHKYKFHNPITTNNTHPISPTIPIPTLTKKYNCKKCNKEFGSYKHKWRHEKNCNQNLQIINNISNTTNITNNITNKIKNIIKITFNINKLGDENINLNNKEIEELFKKYGQNITKFIELVNFNKKLPENHLFCTTDLKSKYLNVYDTNTKLVIKDRKKYFFDSLLQPAIERIEKLNKTVKINNIDANHDNIKKTLEFNKEFQNKTFNDKLLKELHNQIELISYNKKKIVKETWDGKNNSSNYKLIRKIKKLIYEINLIKI